MSAVRLLHRICRVYVGATLAATGASSTGQLVLAASIAVMVGALMTWAMSARRRRADFRAAGE